jgi:hypothetical protein
MGMCETLPHDTPFELVIKIRERGTSPPVFLIHTRFQPGGQEAL